MRWIGGLAGLAAIGIAASFLFRFANPPNALPPCQPAPGEDSVACSTIDGLWIGPGGTDCAISPPSCEPQETVAIAAFDARIPGHPAIERLRRYGIDMARLCGPTLCAYSGGQPSIWVFDLADRTRRAVEVTCPGVAPCAVVPPSSE
jgi:hypothetical protein